MGTIIDSEDTVKPLLITGTPDVTPSTFKELRQLTQLINPGVMGSNDYLVSSAGAGQVTIQNGYCWVAGTTETDEDGQHKYGVALTADKTLTGITSPSVSPRTDQVVLRVYDAGDDPVGSGGLVKGQVQYIANASEGAAVEAVPGNAIRLATVSVTTGGVLTITDNRIYSGPRLVEAGIQAFTASGTIKDAAGPGHVVTFTGAASQTLTLPPATIGNRIEVWNIDTSDNVAVARAGTDTIVDNLTAGVTSFNIPAGARASFVCVSAGVWRANYLGPVTKVGSFTASAGTGNKAVTGVGFRPKRVDFTFLSGAGTTNASIGNGSMDAAGNQHVEIKASDGSAASQNSATDGCIGVPAATINSNFYNKAAFVSMDGDGFTVNFSIHTAPVPVGYRAFA